LIILGKDEENKIEIARAFRNLPYLKITDSQLSNAHQILSSCYLILTYSALLEIEKKLN
jgi:hypothetical protein